MSELTFDPRLDVTAGELRACGVQVPPDIPDCAHVPRASIRYAQGEPAKMDPNDPTKITLSVSLTFMQPFRWIAIEATVE